MSNESLSAYESGTATLAPEVAPHRVLAPAVASRRHPAAPRGRGDWFEWAVIAAFAAVSMWCVALNLFYAAQHGLVWTGIDGQYPVDQMQYLAWIRDASQHVLVSDLFVLRPTPHDYLQPMIALSGGLVTLGMAPWLALLLWKPVAVIVVCLAVRAYCRRMVEGRFARGAALALALFAAGYGVIGDEWLPYMSWGYPFGLIGLAAMLGALLCYDRARREGRVSLWAPPLALLAAWVHPWQGEILIFVVVTVELAEAVAQGWWKEWRRFLSPALTIAAAAAPLLYYALLAAFDFEWRMGHAATAHPFPIGRIFLSLAPLLLGAALAYRSRPRGFLETATRVWPLAVLAVWGLNETPFGATPLHAWTGITVPLAILAVQGVQGLKLSRQPAARYLAAICVAALTIPGTWYVMAFAHYWTAPSTHAQRQNLITHSEQRALSYLAHSPVRGGVLTAFYLGAAVPGETGRRTFVGDNRWSQPDPTARANAAWDLLHGWLHGAKARAFVMSTGARFILQDCRSHADLTRSLGPLIESVHRFGCAGVYEVG